MGAGLSALSCKYRHRTPPLPKPGVSSSTLLHDASPDITKYLGGLIFFLVSARHQGTRGSSQTASLNSSHAAIKHRANADDLLPFWLVFFFVWENQSYKSVVWTLRNTEHPPCFIADLEMMGGRDLCAEPGWLSHPVFSFYAKPKLLELRIYPTDTCWSSHLNVKGKNKQEFLSCTSSQRGSLFYVAVAGNHPFCDQNYLYNVDEMSAPLNMLPGSDVQDTSVLVCVREK